MSLGNSLFLIYGKKDCQHCTRAVNFAKANDVDFLYYVLDEDYTKEELIQQCAPVIPRTVPQIFRETDSTSEYIGGADAFISFVKENQ